MDEWYDDLIDIIPFSGKIDRVDGFDAERAHWQWKVPEHLTSTQDSFGSCNDSSCFSLREVTFYPLRTLFQRTNQG